MQFQRPRDWDCRFFTGGNHTPGNTARHPPTCCNHQLFSHWEAVIQGSNCWNTILLPKHHQVQHHHGQVSNMALWLGRPRCRRTHCNQNEDKPPPNTACHTSPMPTRMHSGGAIFSQTQPLVLVVLVPTHVGGCSCFFLGGAKRLKIPDLDALKPAFRAASAIFVTGAP